MRRLNFCFWLAILASLSLWTPGWGQPTIPKMQVTVINNSGYPDNQVYVAFLMQPGYDSTNWYRISDWSTGAFTMFNPTDNNTEVPPGSGNYYANYSTTLDQLNQNPDGPGRYFQLPECLNSEIPTGVATGRLWLSIIKPVYFQVISASQFTQPNPSNSSDVNNNTIWDFFEPNVSYDPTTYVMTANADTTNVDYTIMPLTFALYNNGTLAAGPVGLNYSRTQVYGSMNSVPLLNPLIDRPYRIWAPGHGQSTDPTQPFYFPANYFDPYVQYCWDQWNSSTNQLSFNCNSDVWTGYVGQDIPDTLTLTGAASGEVHHISKPASQDVFLCNGAFNGSGDQWGNTMQVYNPASNSWSTMASLSTNRSSMAAGVIDNLLYVAGGKTPVSGVVSPTQAVNVLEVYDPTANSWTAKASMPTARQDAGAAVIGGKLYVVGGQTQDNGGWVNILEVYDPTTNSWDTTKQSMPTARRGLAVVALGGQLYAMGGEGAAGVLNTVEVYDPGSDQWTTSTTPLPLALLAPMAVVINDTLYVAGGQNAQYQVTGNFYSYTTAGGWTTLTAMPLSVSNSQAVGIGGMLYIASGLTSTTTHTVAPQVLWYDPGASQWHSNNSLPPIPTPVYNYGGGAINSMFYVAGGLQYNSTRFTNDAALKNRVGAALNRSVMHLPPYKDPDNPSQYPWGDYTADYYKNTATPQVPADNFVTNIYSYALHQQAINGLIYGFAYDDNNNQSSLITAQGTEIRLTINNCRLAGPNYLLLLDN